MEKKCRRYSGIGGQAVLEGIMMKNQEEYAVAVRKADGDIVVDKGSYAGVLGGSGIKKIPFVRGIFNFIDSLVLGTRCLNYSASFYEEEEEDAKGGSPVGGADGRTKDAAGAMERRKGKEDTDDREDKGGGDKVMTVAVTCVAVALAIGLFIVLPYFLASLFRKYILNRSLITIIEGVIRILIFILYIWGISVMKDVKRLYCYHGAEHKCINCIERGRPLTVSNVMRSSRLHKRCGTSFLFFVFFVSIILFFFIRVDNLWARVAVRILLMPVVAGISYEIIRLAGRSDNIFVSIASAPGMAIQRMTTKEPDEAMVEVAIAAVEAVFDWKGYLRDNFGYEGESTSEKGGFGDGPEDGGEEGPIGEGQE